jgi:Uncharacterized conserved protein, contains double-stranded beta-helix domain
MHVNSDDIEWIETNTDEGETTFRRKQLSAAADGEHIGCSLYELPPDKRSWPYHYHEGNDEAIYVLSGTGSVRLKDGTHAVSAGDYVSLPAGEAGAHRVINDSDDDVPLRYLAISTMQDPDVVIYPDMDKVGVYTGTPPGRHEGRKLTKYYPEDADVDYWPDESDPD